ncbi:MAG: four helix bundle protein [Salibacteraceae bacterium]
MLTAIDEKPNKMRDFKKYSIWKQAFDLCVECYSIVEELPDNEKFGLRSQVTRAAVSIPSNIAEGTSRNSDLEFKRFLEIAIGSSFELETQVMIADELGMLNSLDTSKFLARLRDNQASINALIQKLKK